VLTVEEIEAQDSRLAETVHVQWPHSVRQGRPTTVAKGRRVDVATLLWVRRNGRPVPADLVVVPGCGRALCVRPRHLVARSPDAAARG
jgi:hypothetical protein